jgi:hypothetical protein
MHYSTGKKMFLIFPPGMKCVDIERNEIWINLKKYIWVFLIEIQRVNFIHVKDPFYIYYTPNLGQKAYIMLVMLL